MSKEHPYIETIEKLHITIYNQDNQIADLEAKLAESERLIFTYQNIFRQKPETATEMCEFLQPYEIKLKLSELEIDKLKQQLAEKQSKIQELNDMYEDLLCAKGTEHELKQAKEDVEMLDERRLCLFSLLYETLEKQGCENITSTIEQMTNLHLNKCSHWYKNNRVCDELQKQLAEKDKRYGELHKYYNEDLREKYRLEDELKVVQKHHQDKISFAVAELEKAKIEFETYYADNIWNYPQYLEDRIAELTHQHEDKGE